MCSQRYMAVQKLRKSEDASILDSTLNKTQLQLRLQLKNVGVWAMSTSNAGIPTV